MIESYYPSVDELVAEQRARKIYLMILLILAVIVVFGTIGVVIYFYPGQTPFVAFLGGLSVFLLLALPVIIWNNPRYGLYTLFIGAILFGGSAGADNKAVLTTYVPFWLNISTASKITGYKLSFIPFSFAEFLMVLTVLCWLIRAIAKREFRLQAGAGLYLWIAYLVVAAMGWVYGVTTGGDTTMALYEVRAQVHFFIVYLLAANLITERKHVVWLLWIAVFAVGTQGLFGTYAYITARQEVTEAGIMAHDDSLSMNMLFFLLFLAIISRFNRPLMFWSLLLTPFAVVAALANQRRAGIAAFIIAFVPLIPMLLVHMKERKLQVIRFAVFFALASAVYLPVAWTADGPWALPARAIRSRTEPNARDAASNAYRAYEDANLKKTRDLRPWLGVGYGKPLAQYHALPKVTTDFVMYMPHNSILWVWMRLGHLGFFIFMMFIAVILIRGNQILHDVHDMTLKVAGILGILYLLMLFTFASYDLQLVNPRQMVITAVLLGVLSVLDRIDARDRGEDKEPVPAAVGT
jgi:hypothetical protein